MKYKFTNQNIHLYITYYYTYYSRKYLIVSVLKRLSNLEDQKIDFFTISQKTTIRKYFLKIWMRFFENCRSYILSAPTGIYLGSIILEIYINWSNILLNFQNLLCFFTRLYNLKNPKRGGVFVNSKKILIKTIYYGFAMRRHNIRSWYEEL